MYCICDLKCSIYIKLDIHNKYSSVVNYYPNNPLSEVCSYTMCYNDLNRSKFGKDHPTKGRGHSFL